ncbi:HEAT repeat domain-containing protein [Actinomadura sp. DC4]|uniref:HEAT repeat domain-containing protein n=1 Tax=Actinomadura sp. DC4 TaxID=3055069 RepID=UPI0025B2341C|nr:HEAT repeat domain-containing protein [Actinomadura sp. DC4]MDN3353691.1 HEAT repeat domain-containing protein [Actinomadura sp. DC4]
MGAEHQLAFFIRELAAPDAARRAAAAKGLGRVGRAEHAQTLVRAARDPEPVVRAAVALGLGRLGVRGTGDALTGLMEDTDPGVRRRATVAVDRLALAGPDIVSALGRRLHDADRHVRLNALVRLTALRTPGDIAALVRLLADPDATVRGHARGLVSTLTDDEAVLAEVLKTARQGSGELRVRALEVLPARHAARLRDAMLDGLHDPDPEVRKLAADMLLRERGTADALLTVLEKERDPRVARTLLNIPRNGGRRLQAVAVRWLGDPHAGPSAVRALAGIGTPAAVRQVKTALGRGQAPGVRSAAASALGRIGDRQAVDLLLPLLRDPDRSVRTGALDGLRLLSDHRLPSRQRRRVAEALTGRLAADPGEAWYVRNALSGYPEALPRVRRLADSGSGDVRAAALSLLDETDAARFLAYLDDPDEPVRYHAVLGLGRYVHAHGTLPAGRDGTADLLTALAAGDSPRTRQAAADVLARTGRA